MFAVGGWFVLFVGEEWDSVANPDVQTGENVGYFCCSTSLDATARGVGCVSMEAGIGHVRQWHRYDKIDIREIYTYTRCSVRHLQ